jgi:hypothetical protein
MSCPSCFPLALHGRDGSSNSWFAGSLGQKGQKLTDYLPFASLHLESPPIFKHPPCPLCCLSTRALNPITTCRYATSYCRYSSSRSLVCISIHSHSVHPIPDWPYWHFFSYVSYFLNVPLLYKFISNYFLTIRGLDGHFPISNKEPKSKVVSLFNGYYTATSGS